MVGQVERHQTQGVGFTGEQDGKNYTEILFSAANTRVFYRFIGTP